MDIRKVHIASMCALALCLGPACFAQAEPKAAPAVNQDSLILQDFEKRVADYIKLRKQVEVSSPAQKPTNSSSKLADYSAEMAPRMRAARPSARPGDIFTAQIGELFRRLIATSFSGSNGRKLRASLRHAEPVRGMRLEVNADYPEKTPLQSTPPSLLIDLPKLPAELEYRIVGRDLVLRDVGANLIVDFIPGAIPPS